MMQAIDLLKAQEMFLKNLSSTGKSFNTQKNYRIDLNCFFEYYIKKYKSFLLTSFDSKEANEYNHFLENRYHSPNSIRRGVQSVRLFFDFLINYYDFPNNPLKSLSVAPKVVKKPDPPPFVDIQKLSDFLKTERDLSQGLSKMIALRNLVIVHLIYHAGTKVSDLEEVKVSDILFDQDSDQSRLLVKPPKREPFSVPMPAVTTKLIQQYLKELPSKNYLLFNANAYKLISGGISSRGVELLFSEFRSKLKINMTARSLRQACVFRWLTQGKPESLIKEWLNVAPSYSLMPYIEEFNKHALLYQDLNYEP